MRFPIRIASGINDSIGAKSILMANKAFAADRKKPRPLKSSVRSPHLKEVSKNERL